MDPCQHFDAIIVATGRYNAPNIPNISGAELLASRFPGHIQHSRQYRRPDGFTNKTVLIVGAGVSGYHKRKFKTLKINVRQATGDLTRAHHEREASVRIYQSTLRRCYRE